jgi:hypothetical protein
MPVVLAATGHRALAADVERGERIELTDVRLADDHAVLLMHGRIGSGRFHAAEFERRPFVFVEIRQDLRGLDGFGREAQRRPGAHGACRFRNRRTVFGDEQTADAVIGARGLVRLTYRDQKSPKQGCVITLPRLHSAIR